MNRYEREQVSRFAALWKKIPLPHDGLGAKTASIRGAISYAQDMREANRFLHWFTEGLVICSYPEHLIDPELFVYSPQEVIDKFQAWLDQRSAEGWK